MQPTRKPGRPKGKPLSQREAASRLRNNMKQALNATRTGRSNREAKGPTLPVANEAEDAAVQLFHDKQTAQTDAAKAKAQRELAQMQIATGDLIPRQEVTDYISQVFLEVRKELDHAPELIAAYPDITRASAAHVTEIIMNITKIIRNRIANNPIYLGKDGGS